MSEVSPLTRRKFLRDLAGAGLMAAGGALPARPTRPVAARSRVVLIRDRDVQDGNHTLNAAVLGTMLDRGVCALAGTDTPDQAWKQYFSPGDLVGVKINVMMLPTPPALQQALVRRLHDVGVPPDQVRITDREARDLLAGCTALINTCAFKTHWLSGVAGAVKNYLPFAPRTPEGDWANFHPHACAAVGGVHNLPVCRGKTRLVITDMLYPLFHGGPQVNPHYRWAYNGLVIATDPVAADVVCLRLVEAKRRAVKGAPWPLSPPPLHLETAAMHYHLGQWRWDRIDLVKPGGEDDRLL